MSKVLLAMSGGVDSSVAAALLQRDGHEVVGCFMRLGSPGEELDEGLVEDAGQDRDGACDPHRLRIGHRGCCSINDAADARRVAARLDIPFYVLNFKRDFGRVIDYFVDEYNAGRTPNPCVRCNDWLKFGRLHAYARQIDAEFVASGHYARITGNGGAHRLERGVDHGKDQSYVLFGTPRDRLAEMLLPIGGLEKPAVRELAAELDLPVHDKPDSQEICFVPDDDYAGLVRRRAPEAVEPGPILDRDGTELGRHAGHQHFTVGQRRGLGLAAGVPLYVLERDPARNAVTVGPREALAAGGCVASRTNWLLEPPPAGAWRRCSVKIRYNAAPVDAELAQTGEDELSVRFASSQDAVAPGQAVVCYDGDAVWGGGWIDRALP